MNLHVVTTFSTGIPHGHEGQPLVFGDTMYVVTPFPNNLIAVDLTKPGGAVKWIYEPHPDQRAVGIACCDLVNRGATLRGRQDHLQPARRDRRGGRHRQPARRAWRTKVGEINRGETFTAAPIVVKDHVLVGNSGGELGVRGYVAALDVKTGKELWRAFNTGPDTDVKIGPDFTPSTPRTRVRIWARRSWPAEQWKLGGSTVWGWMSYDPETNLFFYGTGNPGVWNADLRPGDNKWSSLDYRARRRHRRGALGLSGDCPRFLGLRRDHGERPSRHGLRRTLAQADRASGPHRFRLRPRSRNRRAAVR